MPHDQLLAIFDHDGVLVDSFELHQQAWLELGRRCGLPITPAFIHETFGMTNPSILTRLLGEIPAAEMERYSNEKEVCYRDLARGRITLMPGMPALLDALTALGVKLAIGSSGPRANLELTVEECGLEGRFSAIASLEDVTRGKPDPQVFLVAAQRSGVAPGGCVVFEDAPVGIQAAKAAGMLAVALLTTHAEPPLRAAGADHIVADLAALDPGSLVATLRNNYSV